VLSACSAFLAVAFVPAVLSSGPALWGLGVEAN
jgi:hypothetical protein